MSLIDANDQWGNYAVITCAAAAGIQLESTVVGKSLSGPICAMLLTAVLTNIGVLPPEPSPYVGILQSFVVKIATPLLLLGADVVKIIRETGRLLLAFAIAGCSTLLGSTVAFFFLKQQLVLVGDEVWQVGAALTAKNIGGGLNYVAVADSLNLSPKMVSTGLAVDNILGLIYFPLVSWLGRNEGPEVTANDKDLATEQTDQVTLQGAAVAIGLATALTAAAEKITACAPFLGSGASLPAVTALTVLLATLFAPSLKTSIPSGELLGKLFLFLFFASVGASSGTVAGTLFCKEAAVLGLFGLILYVIHLGVSMSVGMLLGIPLKELLIASNASIGNAATASAMAAAKQWNTLFLPSLLVGSAGNSIGTFAGLWLGFEVLQKIIQSVGLG